MVGLEFRPTFNEQQQLIRLQITPLVVEEWILPQ